VCFADAASAQRAIQESVLLKVNEKTIYVSELVSRNDRKRENLTRINQRNDRQAQGQGHQDQGMRPHLRPEQYLGPVGGFAARPGVADGIVQYPFQPQEIGAMPGGFPAPGPYPGFAPAAPPSPKEKVKGEILERFGPGTPLLKSLQELSDEQIKTLASNQELLNQWFLRA
jgi:RNA recognition motif-containing protein